MTTHVTVLGNVAHYLGLLEYVLHRYDEADFSIGRARVSGRRAVVTR